MNPDELAADLTGRFPQIRSAWQTVEGAIGQDTLGFPLDRILLAVVVFLLFYILRRPLRSLVLLLLTRLIGLTATKQRDQVIEALRGPIGLLPVALGAYFAFEIVRADEGGQIAVISAHVVASLVLAAVFWALFGLVTPLVESLRPYSGGLTQSMIDWIRRILASLVAFLGGAAILQEWGVQVGPLLAGMGIAGAAVALGAQDLFKNLIAGILILAEKRFQYGDWVKVDGVVDGTVEYIGFRSTKVRNFDDTLVQVPNTDLSDKAVTNYSAMRRRRIYWTIGVPYSTTVDQLREIRDGIEAYILDSGDFVSPKEMSTFVRIDSFGASSINIMVYCFTKTTIWAEWLAAKERLAYKLMDIVYGAGSSFAFPSTSLYVESLPEGKPDRFLPPDEDGKPQVEEADDTPRGPGATDSRGKPLGNAIGPGKAGPSDGSDGGEAGEGEAG
ncbi:mechanosensitive ion channel family protein [Amorphus orientalis]|uniref:MscS family membrane protein n=1 Tax=Amorphus orientalis TaxID=649198 RepID=A0AAE3VL24_9HYPH|nr:mechanosensitive ion channel family protein [Amorphus orientalis]MDQ0313997.1 MscS family membrane protein [Amorphus orientalis]